MITRRPWNPVRGRVIPKPDVWAAQSQKVRDRWWRRLVGWPQPQPGELGPGVVKHILEDAAPVGERKWAVRLEPDAPEQDDDTCELLYVLEQSWCHHTRWRVWRCLSGWGWSRAIVIGEKIWMGPMYNVAWHRPVRWASEPSPVDARDLPRAIRIALRRGYEAEITQQLDNRLRRYRPSPVDLSEPKWYVPSADPDLCDVVRLDRDGDEWRLVCVGHQCRLSELSPRWQYLTFTMREYMVTDYITKNYASSAPAPEPYASAWRVARNALDEPAGELKGTPTCLFTWVGDLRKTWIMIDVQATKKCPARYTQWYIMPDGKTAYAGANSKLFVRLPE